MNDYRRRRSAVDPRQGVRTPAPPPSMPAYPEDDRYGMESGKKAVGFPLGQPTMFKHGRILRDCHWIINWDYRGPVAPAGTDQLAVACFTTDKDEAALIRHVQLQALALAQDNIDARWQIWAEGHQLAAGGQTQTPTELDIYIPPICLVTTYFRVINNAANAIYFQYALNTVKFNAGNDVWTWGTANQRPNPAIGAVVWP